MIRGFKNFIMRGSVIDLAVGVIIGAAFGKIVTSLVEDIIMPPIGLIMGRVDFTSLFVSLNGQHFDSLAQAKAAGAPTLNYGNFINTIVQFLIVGFAVYMMIRQITRYIPKQEAPVAQKECPYCASLVPLKAVKCAHCTSGL